jgi:hypothetical protein
MAYALADLTDLTGRRTLFLFSKIFIGAGIGILMSTCQTYVSEISPLQLRGALLGFFSFIVVSMHLAQHSRYSIDTSCAGHRPIDCGYHSILTYHDLRYLRFQSKAVPFRTIAFTRQLTSTAGSFRCSMGVLRPCCTRCSIHSRKPCHAYESRPRRCGSQIIHAALWIEI